MGCTWWPLRLSSSSHVGSKGFYFCLHFPLASWAISYVHVPSLEAAGLKNRAPHLNRRPAGLMAIAYLVSLEHFILSAFSFDVNVGSMPKLDKEEAH